MGLLSINKRGLSIDMDDYDKRRSIDTPSEDNSHEEETEDCRTKWLTHLSFDPRSVAEQEGKIDLG